MAAFIGQLSQMDKFDVENYRKLDYSQDLEQINKNAKIYGEMVKANVRREGPMPAEIWQTQENQNLLLNVFNEIPNDSENDFGIPQYKEEKDTELKVLREKRDKLIQDFKARVEKIKQENRIKRQRGEKEEKVPTMRELEDDYDMIILQAKIEDRRRRFRDNIEEERKRIFRVGEVNEGVYDGERPSLINQLNVAINNLCLTFDKRVEMAILALRERRRFNQCRKLGLKVPLSYTRIYSIRQLPNAIQKELMRYPSAILDDSEYEDDDQQKREKLEGGEQPRRIYAAREKAGDFRYKDLLMEMLIEADHQLLEDNGVKRGLTKEKLDGTYKRPAHITEKFLAENRVKYFIETVKKFYDKYGDQMFIKQDDIRDRMLKMLKGNRIMLRKYPEVIKGMYAGTEEEIPEDLRVEDNRHKSIVVQEMEDHLSRRQSKAGIPEGENQSEEVSVFEEMDKVNQSLKDLDIEGEPSQPIQSDQDAEQQQSQSNKRTVRKSDIYKQETNQEEKQILLKVLDDLSSGSSGQRREKFKNQEAVVNQERQIISMIEKEQLKREEEFWHESYDLILKRCNDLGLKTLLELVPDDSKRTLSRREQTSIFLWGNLGSSAEESDDSIQQANFSHPLLQARQAVHMQKRIPIKRIKKVRKPTEKVSIDGKIWLWGDFSKTFYEDIERRARENNEQITKAEFILNKGDPEKEKLLQWNYKLGFESENSDDERTKYARIERQYKRERIQKHGKEPYLRQREILPFEKLMLRFGGADTLRQLTGKSIDSKQVDTVYEWVDPQRPVFFDFGDFLLQQSQHKFFEIYDKEKAMQIKVMPAKQVKNSVFANELLQLYLLFSKTVKDKELRFPKELQKCLPKSKREYQENINFQAFQTPTQSPRRESYLIIQSAPPNFTQEQPVDYQDYDQQQDWNQEEQFDNEEQAKEEYFSIQKKSPIIKPKAIKEVQQVIELEQPKFQIPSAKNGDFDRLQKQLYQFEETIFVDDYLEIKNMLAELKALDPYKLEQKLIPRLEQLVKDSNGRLKGYFIWPHHRVGGDDLIYPNGRRYPKRLKLYKHQPENKAIHVGGIEVGYLIANVPYLNPDTWKGIGIPLNNQNNQRAPSKEKIQAAGQKQAAQNSRQPDKKRKQGQALKLGAGMNDYHKDDAMFKIEEQLPFMKYYGEGNERLFELIDIDEKFNNGKQFKITLAILPQQMLHQQSPVNKPVIIINTNKIRAKLKISYIESRSNDQRRKQMFLDDQLKLGQNTIWNLTNTANHPIEVSFIINK